MKARILRNQNGLEFIGDENNCCIGSISELKKCDNVLVEKAQFGYNIMIDNNLFTNVQRPVKINGRFGTTYIIWL